MASISLISLDVKQRNPRKIEIIYFALNLVYAFLGVFNGQTFAHDIDLLRMGPIFSRSTRRNRME